jgi:transcriptional regulator with XRE-family HTH domain
MDWIDTPETSLLIEIREALREERIRRRMSQADAASLLGCSRKRILEFELGLVSPSFAFVTGYARILGAGVSFVPGEGDHVDFKDLNC